MEASYLTVSLLILVLSVLFVAFFSSAEAGLIAASRIRIRHLAEQGNRPAKSVQRVLEKHENFFDIEDLILQLSPYS